VGGARRRGRPQVRRPRSRHHLRDCRSTCASSGKSCWSGRTRSPTCPSWPGFWTGTARERGRG